MQNVTLSQGQLSPKDNALTKKRKKITNTCNICLPTAATSQTSKTDFFFCLLGNEQCTESHPFTNDAEFFPFPGGRLNNASNLARSCNF